MPLSCAFFGAYPLSLAALKALLVRDDVRVRTVFTLDPKAPKYAPFHNHVLDFLREQAPAIPVVLTAATADIEAAFPSCCPAGVDLIVCCAYPFKIPASILGRAQIEALNLHPSMLPRYRGADPVRRVILNGETETGITLHRLVSRFDAGPIFAQRLVALFGNEDAGALSLRLSQEIPALLDEGLRHLRSGLAPQEQDESLATFAPAVLDEELHLSLDLDLQSLSRRIRAGWPFRPARFCTDYGTLSLAPPVVIENENHGNKSVRVEGERCFLELPEACISARIAALEKG